MDKYVLVTGGASGIGRAITEYLAQNNYKVFCTDINLYKGEQNPNIIPLVMDVTSSKAIEAAKKEILKTTDTLHAIINNAGIFVMDSFVEIAEEKLQKIIDINIMGMYRVNKIFLSMLKGGYSKIINISSEVAQYSSAPFSGPYTLSKYGVEAYTDALRRELLILDIPVIKIRPGSLKTNMLGDVNKNYDELIKNTQYFKGALANMNSMMANELNKTNDPVLLAQLVQKILESNKPKMLYRVVNSKQLKMMSMFPEKTQDKIYKKILSPKTKK